jgi:hypothetical protein
MTEAVASPRLADREAVLHALYEAAELEHRRAGRTGAR